MVAVSVLNGSMSPIFVLSEGHVRALLTNNVGKQLQALIVGFGRPLSNAKSIDCVFDGNNVTELHDCLRSSLISSTHSLGV